MAPFPCIYCRDPLGPDTPLAHVVPSALGGRLAARTICCGRCNNAIGVVENDLCSALREASAAVGALDADNQPIHAKVTADGKTYDYASGVGEEVLPSPRPKDGGLVFPLPGKPEDLAAAIAKRLWAASLPLEALDDGRLRIEPDTTFGVQPHPPHPEMFGWLAVLGTTPHMRVVLKMALELLAHALPEEARRCDELSKARRYIRQGEDDGTLPARFDALSDGPGLFNAQDLPLLAHVVEVWTNRANVHYRVTLFGGLHVTGSLTTNWGGAKFALGHALDPTKPARHLDERRSSDGPSLGVYHTGLKEGAFAKFQNWFLARTRAVSIEVAERPWSAPGEPDLKALRPLIEREYTKFLKRKKQPKPKGSG